MDMEQALKKFGLNDKEIKIYLALLQLGRATVLSIAKKAGIKRPTAYLILESLMTQGLASKIPRKNKTLYIAENPKKLLKELEQKKREMEKIMPNLLSIYNLKADKPAVKMYEGREGVLQVYEEIFKSKEVWWFGNVKSVYNNFREAFEVIEGLIKAKKMTLRDLMGNSEFEREYARTHQRANHEIRISKFPINIDFSIFGDKIAVISLEENLYALIIEDKRITDSFRSMYELAWGMAEK
jgi:HTH-type transcriptional regulator, sugar sensing transcriptional regulator